MRLVLNTILPRGWQGSSGYHPYNGHISPGMVVSTLFVRMHVASEAMQNKKKKKKVTLIGQWATKCKSAGVLHSCIALAPKMPNASIVLTDGKLQLGGRGAQLKVSNDGLR